MDLCASRSGANCIDRADVGGTGFVLGMRRHSHRECAARIAAAAPPLRKALNASITSEIGVDSGYVLSRARPRFREAWTAGGLGPVHLGDPYIRIRRTSGQSSKGVHGTIRRYNRFATNDSARFSLKRGGRKRRT